MTRLSVLSRRAASVAALTISLLLIAAFLPAGTNAAALLNYSFTTDSEIVDVHILKDGSIDIDYVFVFTNYGEMDGVDVGLPNSYYQLSSASAEIIVGGTTYAPARLRESPYVAIGVAVEFTSTTMSAISSPGTSFTLKFHINNPHMVYVNDLVPDTVGVAFWPTWFSSQYQQGDTGFLQCRMFFPEGFNDNSSAIYLQDRPWHSLELDEASGLYVATWSASNVSPGDQAAGMFDVGVGFPTQYVNRYYQEPPPSDGSGSQFVTSLGDVCVTLLPVIMFAAIIGLMAWGSIRSSRKRASDYFEPKLSVAGAGPRRDLTAVEAAVALERPIEMVATMILFGLVKKEKVRIQSEQYPMRLLRLSDRGDYPYEDNYLMSVKSDGTMDRDGLTRTMVVLIKATQSKLEGFDFDATRQYYRTICDTAWKQVQAAGTPEDFANVLGQQHDWMMLDPSYERRMERIYLGPYPYHTGTRTATTQSAGAGSSVKSMQQMAKGYADRVKNSCSNLVRDTKGLARDITGKTNPVPVVAHSTRSGWGGGGFGGGGGCACACACACAGGGR